MSEQDRSYITRLFAKCVAFAFVFIIVAMIGGLIAGRVMGIEVNADRVFGIIGPAFTMILAAAIGIVSGGGRAKSDDKTGPAAPEKEE